MNNRAGFYSKLALKNIPRAYQILTELISMNSYIVTYPFTQNVITQGITF